MITKKWMTGAFVVAITLPIVCNLFIQCNSPNCIHVIGEQTDWLSFFGGYLGSVFASLASFVILFYTLKESRRESELEMRHKEILMNIDDMSKRFAEYNVTDIIRLGVQVRPTKEKIGEEITRLQILHEKFQSLYFSGKLWYGHPKLEAEKLFYEEYTELLFDTIQLTKQLILFYSTLTNDEFYLDDNCKEKMMDFAKVVENLTKRKEDVFLLADSYLQDTIKDFNKHQFLQL